MEVARCCHWVTAWWPVCEEARTAPCQIQLLVASSNRHKAEQAEHLSQDGNTAKKMYLGKSMRNSSKNTKVSEKKRRKRCFRHQSTDSPAVHGKDLTGAHEYFLKELHLPGEPVLEQVYPERLQPMGRIHSGEEGKCEEARVEERGSYGLTATPIPHLPCTI